MDIYKINIIYSLYLSKSKKATIEKNCYCNEMHDKDIRTRKMYKS